MLDSSFFALNTDGRRQGIANDFFGNLKLWNRYIKVQEYPEHQTYQSLIAGWHFSVFAELKFIDVDTSSDNILQFKSRVTECIITGECKRFCEFQNFIDTLNECLFEIKDKFTSAVKIKAELEYFPDGEDCDSEPHVIIEVRVNSSREIAESDYEGWLKWFIKKIPDSIRKYFVLTIDRA
jgi:hypothetical protein